MKKLLLLLTFLTVALTSYASWDVKTVSTSTEYKLTPRDSGYLIAMQTPKNSLVKFVVPSERTTATTFGTGSEIYGTALSDGTINIVGEDGVTILQADDAFRTRKMGSQWKLTRISRNFWLLEGDLYSLQVDAYIGDDIIIKANVDAAATGPLRFVWYKNNVLLTGRTTAGLKLTNITATDAGSYRVEARNTAGLVKSETTSLVVR
jgi:hypothetical protein